MSLQLDYNPGHLLDILIEKLKARNDAGLARKLDIAPCILSKIRHHKVPVGAAMLIRMNEVTGMDVSDLRTIMGDRRERHRLSTSKPTQYQLSQRKENQ